MAEEFVKIKKQLTNLVDEVRCVACGRVPTKMISTGSCDHKYCRLCIEKAKAKKMCVICDVPVDENKIKVDKFFSDAAEKVAKLVSAFNEGVGKEYGLSLE